MSVFGYLILIGIIQLVFSFLWNYIVMLLAIILISIKIEKQGIHIVRALGYYIYVGLISLTTLYFIEDKSTLTSIISIGLGTFFIYLTIGQGIYEGRKQAYAEGNFNYLLQDNFDSYYLIGAIILYLASILIIPSIVLNTLVFSAYRIISWLANLPIIGFLLGIGGFMSMAGTIFTGVIMLVMLIVSIFNKSEKSVDANQEEASIDEENKQTSSLF